LTQFGEIIFPNIQKQKILQKEKPEMAEEVPIVLSND
jgi:hypothetical protein